MFKKQKNNTEMAKVQESNPNAVNQIVQGTSVVGDVIAEQSIRIDGTLEGNLTTKGRAIVGKSGKVKGNIDCVNGDIEGTVTGTMKVDQLLSLKSTAVIEGEIATSQLSIEPGAIFNATCDMSGKKQQHVKGGGKKE
jgi:cytoskeletal protein CcmA (bactofilin family)